MKQTSILEQDEEQTANDSYTVLPTVKKAVLHEPNIELLNVDCLHYMKQCEDKQFDLAIVDPPYGIEVNKMGLGKGKKKQSHKVKTWDNAIPTKEYFDELKRISKNQIVWGGNYFFDYLGNTRCVINWDKIQDFSGSDFELGWTSFDKPAKTFRMSRVEAYGKGTIHPTQKPKKLYEWILKNYANEGDKIIDTHLGSGSIALACYNYKFDLVGLEIDKEYFDDANKRLNDYRKQLTLF